MKLLNKIIEYLKKDSTIYPLSNLSKTDLDNIQKIPQLNMQINNLLLNNKEILKINIIELSKSLNKDITNSEDCRFVFQYAIDNYGDIFVPNGLYRISNSLIIKASSIKALNIVGESFANTKLLLDSDEIDTHLFIVKPVSSWNNRYKYIRNISLVANNSKYQSIIRYEETTEGNISDSGIQISKCQIYTSGYVLDYRNCPWVGNSYIKDCDIVGNGIAYVYPKSKLSQAYYHGTSNLVIEDVHFTGTGNRRGSVLYLVGCKNTTITRTTLEGIIYSLQTESDSIGDGFIGCEQFNEGAFITLKDSSVNFLNCWFETNTINNCPNAYSISIESAGESYSNPNMFITFSGGGYYQFDKGVKIGNGIVNGTVQNVFFDNYFSYNNYNPFLIQEGGILSINTLGIVEPNGYKVFEQDNRINIKNTYMINYNGGNYTNGIGNFFSKQSSKILYEYTGGYQDTNLYTNISCNMKYTSEAKFYPHLNLKYGNTLLLKPDKWAFRFAQGNIWIEGKKTVTTYLKYRMIHCKDIENEGVIFTKIYNKSYENCYLDISYGDLHGFGLSIPPKDSCEFLEILSLLYIEGNYDFMEKSKFNNTISYQTKDIYGKVYLSQENLEGTWKSGDTVILADGVTKTKFLSNGTARKINIVDLELVNKKRLKINLLDDFKTLVDGDYLKINYDTKYTLNRIKQISYEDNNYYIDLINELPDIINIDSIVNSEPSKITITV